MTSYRAPVAETLFLLKHVLRIDDYRDIDAFSELSDDLLLAILEGAGQFSAAVLAPINAAGDAEGCTRHPDGSVTTPRGFKAAFDRLREGGWNNLAVSAEDGGPGLPYVVTATVEEYLNSGNQSFCMYSNWGFFGSMLMRGVPQPHLRRDYLARLVSGEWTGTMAMTEPHAGTDLGLMRTKAVPQMDGSYRLTGTKMFISGGDHDLTSNIVHFVLARIEGAPAGSQGLSLFLVPKYLAGPDGAPGEANGVSCGSVEHKMGLRGSATCVMHFDHAQGWLISEPHRGLAQMFRLMNHARRLTGVIAIAGSEAACQRAASYVKERVQGKAPGSHGRSNAAADPLIEQPDVRRVLMTIRSFVDAGRALVLWLSLQLDLQERSPDGEVRQRASDRIALLTPIAKAVLSDMGHDVAIMAQQMFGGHGYIVETGIEQYSRDLRMLSLAEGANGVQAMDLVGRKLVRDGGHVFRRYMADVQQEIAALPAAISDLGTAMEAAMADVAAVAETLIAADVEDAGYGAYDFMTALGLLALGHMWLMIARAAVTADAPEDVRDMRARLTKARFFMSRHLVDVAACLARVRAATDDLRNLAVDAV